jgi:hypothetical protein
MESSASALPVGKTTKHSSHPNRFEIEIYETNQEGLEQSISSSSASTSSSVTPNSTLNPLIRKKGHVMVDPDNPASVDYAASIMKLVYLIWTWTMLISIAAIFY